MNEPLFISPAASTRDSTAAQASRTDLIKVGHAFESMRDAGFDLTAAAGEPIDNSIEAGASVVHVLTKRTVGNKAVETIAFADNGKGITPDKLAHVLQMGYSTRYGERKGLGRFGVGLKLATLSMARRLEVYTRPEGSSEYFSAYLDLDEVRDETQTFIEAVPASGWPEDLAHLMSDQGTGKSAEPRPFGSGTLVVWRKVDRIVSGGPFGTALDERDADLRKFIARAYRKFLDKGMRITLNGNAVTLHDPLFLMDNPRIVDRYRDLRGRIIDQEELTVEGHPVNITVTLVPEPFRPREGAGGAKDVAGKDIRDLQINRENEGRISFLRNDREIYYDIIPRFLPGGVDRIDRYLGIEVSFPADLDEFFQVRHVKRGAEPVDKLRQQLREWLRRPVTAARNEIQNYWGVVKNNERQESLPHSEAHAASRKVEQTAPEGKAGAGKTPEEVEEAVTQIINDVLGGEEAAAAEPERVEELRRSIDEDRIKLLDGNWQGSELFEIKHLNNGKAVMVLNHRHPFMRTFYDPVSDIANNLKPAPEDGGGVVDLARRIETAFDFLLLAYAKAENFHTDPEIFDDMKTHWAMYLKNLVQQWQSGTD